MNREPCRRVESPQTLGEHQWWRFQVGGAAICGQCSVVLWVLGRVQATGPAGFVLLLWLQSVSPAEPCLAWLPESERGGGGGVDGMERAKTLQWGPPEGRGNHPKNNAAVCQVADSLNATQTHSQTCACAEADSSWQSFGSVMSGQRLRKARRPKKTWHAHDWDARSRNECWAQCVGSQHVPPLLCH